MRRYSLAFALGLGLFSVACAVPYMRDGEGAGLAQRDAVLDVRPMPIPEEVALAETGRRSEDLRLGGAVMSCTYRRMQGVQLYEDLVTFDPNADVLWPGAIVQTRSIGRGVLEPIGSSRAPGDITVTNVVIDGAAGERIYSRTVSSPSNASVQEAIGEILRGGTVSTAARVSYRASRVHSLEEAALKIGVDVGWFGGSVKARFEGGYTNTKTTYFVDFTQAYYSVSFETPRSPSSVFDPSVTAADLRPYVGVGNPPAYVASVTYGRRLMLKVESESSESELEAALDAALSVGVNIEAGVAVHYRSVLEKSNITVFGLGGSPRDLAALTQADDAKQLDAVLAYVTNGATYSPQSPPAPLSYTLRYLANNQVARVASTTDFELPECRPAVATATVKLDGFDLVACGGSSSCSRELDVEVHARGADGKDLAPPVKTVVTATSGYPSAIARELVFVVPKSDSTAFSIEASATVAGARPGPVAGKTHTLRLDTDPGATTATIDGLGANALEQTSLPTSNDVRFRLRYTMGQR